MTAPAPLPGVAQEIADVIGRERALYLIGQLPTCPVRDRRAPGWIGRRPVLYVPLSLRADHPLVTILGAGDAERLSRAFGGELLPVPTLHAAVYCPFRDDSMRRMHRNGIHPRAIAAIFGMTERRVRQVLNAK